jgi:hypothetical protein
MDAKVLYLKRKERISDAEVNLQLDSAPSHVKPRILTESTKNLVLSFFRQRR